MNSAGWSPSAWCLSLVSLFGYYSVPAAHATRFEEASFVMQQTTSSCSLSNYHLGEVASIFSSTCIKLVGYTRNRLARPDRSLLFSFFCRFSLYSAASRSRNWFPTETDNWRDFLESSRLRNHVCETFFRRAVVQRGEIGWKNKEVAIFGNLTDEPLTFLGTIYVVLVARNHKRFYIMKMRAETDGDDKKLKNRHLMLSVNIYLSSYVRFTWENFTEYHCTIAIEYGSLKIH